MGLHEAARSMARKRNDRVMDGMLLSRSEGNQVRDWEENKKPGLATGLLNE